MSKKLLFAFIALFLFCTTIFAQHYTGIGAHIGFQHDVNDITNYYPDIQTFPQNNLFFGISLRLSTPFFFLRTGADISYTINKGKVLNNQSIIGIRSYSMKYSSIPVYAGLQYPVMDIGSFYLGGGLCYFIGTGSVKLSDSTSKNINVTSPGIGFIAGIQIFATKSLSVYIEWIYSSAQTKPDIATTGTLNSNSYKDFYINFSGNRLALGVMYYVF